MNYETRITSLSIRYLSCSLMTVTNSLCRLGSSHRSVIALALLFPAHSPLQNSQLTADTQQEELVGAQGRLPSFAPRLGTPLCSRRWLYWGSVCWEQPFFPLLLLGVEARALPEGKHHPYLDIFTTAAYLPDASLHACVPSDFGQPVPGCTALSRAGPGLSLGKLA